MTKYVRFSGSRALSCVFVFSRQFTCHKESSTMKRWTKHLRGSATVEICRISRALPRVLLIWTRAVLVAANSHGCTWSPGQTCRPRPRHARQLMLLSSSVIAIRA
jgi:hypothetical protein